MVKGPQPAGPGHQMKTDAKPYQRVAWFRPVLVGLQSPDKATQNAALERLWFESGIVGPLRSSVMVRVRNPDMAMDVIVDVFTDLPGALARIGLHSQFQTAASLWAFVFDMAKRRCAAHIDKMRRHESRHIPYGTDDELALLVGLGGLLPLDHEEVKHRARELLRDRCAALSDEEWILVLASKLQGATAEELAREYGCSTSAMQKRIQRAQGKLESTYAENEEEPR
jgi:RNA polymerase sigma factor (sigma-70 family)